MPKSWQANNKQAIKFLHPPIQIRPVARNVFKGQEKCTFQTKMFWILILSTPCDRSTSTTYSHFSSYSFYSMWNPFPPIFQESSVSFSDCYHVWLPPLINRYDLVSVLHLLFDIDQYLFVANWSAKTSWPLCRVVYHSFSLSTLTCFPPLSSTQVCCSPLLCQRHILFSSQCMSVFHSRHFYIHIF